MAANKISSDCDWILEEISFGRRPYQPVSSLSPAGYICPVIKKVDGRLSTKKPSTFPLLEETRATLRNRCERCPLKVVPAGPHCAWGMPLLWDKVKTKVDRYDEHFDEEVEATKKEVKIPKDNYSIPSNMVNPPGWFDEKRPIVHMNYVTSNSTYGYIQPTQYSMTVVHRPKNVSFTSKYLGLPVFKDRSLNIK